MKIKPSSFVRSVISIGLVSTGLICGWIVTIPVKAETLSEPRISQSLAQEPAQTPAAQTSWQQFTSESGRYLVEFPGQPTQFTSTTQTLESLLDWNVTEVRIQPTSESSTEYYMVAYADLEPSYLANHNPDDIVRDVSNTVLSEGDLDDNIQLQEPVRLYNHPAHLLIGTVGNQYWVMVLSLVDRRLYTSFAFSAQKERVSHFLDSLVFADDLTATPTISPQKTPGNFNHH